MTRFWIDGSGRWSGGGSVVLRNLVTAAREHPDVLTTHPGPGDVRLVPRNVPVRRADLLAPLVWMPQNALPWGPPAPHERRQQWALRCASAVTALRAAAMVRISGALPALRHGPTSAVLHNVLDEDFDGLVEQLAETTRGNHFYSSGSAHSYRRLPDLVRGFALYRQRGGAADLHVQVAPGSPAALADLLAAARGVPGVTVSQAPADRRVVVAAMAASRGVVFPSAVEASPVTLLEALALGRPVACSAITAHEEMLAGRHVPVFDQSREQVARALSELELLDGRSSDQLADPHERARARARWAGGLAAFLRELT